VLGCVRPPGTRPAGCCMIEWLWTEWAQVGCRCPWKRPWVGKEWAPWFGCLAKTREGQLLGWLSLPCPLSTQHCPIVSPFYFLSCRGLLALRHSCRPMKLCDWRPYIFWVFFWGWGLASSNPSAALAPGLSFPMQRPMASVLNTRHSRLSVLLLQAARGLFQITC
jgi:hypothetical protein